MKMILITLLLGVGCLQPLFAHSSALGRTASEIQHLSIALEMFRHEYAEYPPAENWWAELSGAETAEVNEKRIVYLDGFYNQGLDAWGAAYQYVKLKDAPVELWGVYSFGKDGISSSGGWDRDDIASWRDLSEVHKVYYPPFYRKTGFWVGIVWFTAYMGLLVKMHRSRIRE